MIRVFLILAGVVGASGVGFGALAAHALRDSLSPDAVGWVETAGNYLMFHAPILAVCSLLLQKTNSKTVIVAGSLFTFGLTGFSGGLLILAFTGYQPIVSLIPIGGALLIFAWAVIAIAGLSFSSNGRNS